MTDDTPDHIPAPAEHSPRKRAVQQAEADLLVYEVARADTAWVLCEQGLAEVTR